MTREERIEKLNKVSQLANEIHYIMSSIVWENQEGQDEHFDLLTKSERVALVQLFANANNLYTAISRYKSWFIDGQ